LFQVPSNTRESGSKLGRATRAFYYRFLWDILHPNTPYMGMYGIPKDDVVQLVTQHGGQLIYAAPDPAAEPEWEGYRYLVRRMALEKGAVPVLPRDKAMTRAD
jgi:hypothetical protein